MNDQEIGILLEAKLATDAGSSCLPMEDSAKAAADLAKQGMLVPAKKSAMPPYQTYAITDKGRDALSASL